MEFSKKLFPPSKIGLVGGSSLSIAGVGIRLGAGWGVPVWVENGGLVGGVRSWVGH